MKKYPYNCFANDCVSIIASSLPFCVLENWGLKKCHCSQTEVHVPPSRFWVMTCFCQKYINLLYLLVKDSSSLYCFSAIYNSCQYQLHFYILPASLQLKHACHAHQLPEPPGMTQLLNYAYNTLAQVTQEYIYMYIYIYIHIKPRGKQLKGWSCEPLKVVVIVLYIVPEVLGLKL